MTPEIIIVTVILLVALVLFISEKLSLDLTALGIMVALMVTGLLTPRDAVAGFANPAPLTVGGLFIVTRGLVRTGALTFLTTLLTNLTKGKPKLILLYSLLLVGLLSAFINNTPVVVMMLTVIIALAGHFSLSPARFLMPLSFASILAGTTTLIGTSTNIIVSDQAAAGGMEPLGMFELAKVGLPLAVVGVILLFLLSDGLLPRTRTPILRQDKGAKHKYIAELTIPEGSPLLGREAISALKKAYPEVVVHEVVQGDRVCFPETDYCELIGGDAILLSATAADLVSIIHSEDAQLPLVAGRSMANPYDPNTAIVEAIVPPDSHMLGRRVKDTVLGAADDVVVIGAQRRRHHFHAQDMGRLRLKTGDILLVQCGPGSLQWLRDDSELIIVEDNVPSPANSRRAPMALAIFLAMVGVAALGVANILTAALAGAFLMVISGCLQLHEAYEAVDVPVLMLIIGTIALGAALTASGAADLYASGFLSLFQGLGPRGVLAALIILTSLLSHVLSNNSTAVLLVPIGLAAATAMDVDPRPFIVGICFGASACFASPIGYQTNLLVYGPGGYRFMDFVRLGMVLNVVVWVGAPLLVPLFWSF
ncbi:SLC13 family permease [bacterium DOLZORAL124_64_63]|nr:MAG: SLC13 family permease [bacterium DOLZORAL124_64_63]